MADTPTMAEMLTTLKKELAMAKAISGGPAGHEPAYRYLGDSPGKSVIEAYLQQQQRTSPTEDQRLPVFYVELPPLFSDGPPLVEVLSHGLSLPMRGKWEDQFLAEERLAEQLLARQVELVVLADAHHLSSRPHSVEWLVSYFRRYLNHAPLVLIGEGEQMDTLLLWKATAWVVRRFHRIRLPGEPEAREHTETRADLHRILDRKDNAE